MRLTTDHLIEAALAETKVAKLLELSSQVAELHAKVKVFEATVWFPRLQGQVRASQKSGMSGACRDIEVRTFCSAGRCLIQLERGGHRITLITADDEEPWRREIAHVAPGMGPMGIQGIDAEWLEALKLLYEVTRYGAEIKLVDDPGVSIG